MVVSLLHKMQAPYNCFTLSLCDSNSCKSNSWRDGRHIDIDQDDGDHGVMPVTMEIMTMLWRWRSKAQHDDGHIKSHILITCDFYLLCILFCLVRH